MYPIITHTMSLTSILFSTLLTTVPREERMTIDLEYCHPEVPRNYEEVVVGTVSNVHGTYRIMGYNVFPKTSVQDSSFCLVLKPETPQLGTLVYTDKEGNGHYQAHTCPEGKIISEDSEEFSLIQLIIEEIRITPVTENSTQNKR